MNALNSCGRRLEAGAVAFNGRIITARNAEKYNQEAARADQWRDRGIEPPAHVIASVHRVYCEIIGIKENAS